VGADIGWVGRPFTSGWRPASSWCSVVAPARRRGSPA